MPSLSAISNLSARGGILHRFWRKYSHRASICSGCLRTLVRFFFLLLVVFGDLDVAEFLLGECFADKRYYFLLLDVFAAVVANGVPLLIDSMPDLLICTFSFSDFC